MEKKVIELLKARGIEAEARTVMRNGKPSRCIQVGSGKCVPCIHLGEVEDMTPEEVADVCEQALEMSPDIDLDYFDSKQIKKMIRLGICKAGALNSDVLCRPTIFENIDQYMYLNFEGIGCAALNSDVIAGAGIKEEDAWKWATGNTYDQSVIVNMVDMLRDLLGDMADEMLGDAPESPMLVVTTRDKERGAAAILNQEIIDKASEMCGVDEFFMIPSSIHECLLIPYEEGQDEAVENMVLQVNREQVPEREQLGSRVYVVRARK